MFNVSDALFVSVEESVLRTKLTSRGTSAGAEPNLLQMTRTHPVHLQSLLSLMWDALHDPTLIILVAAAIVSLIIGLTIEVEFPPPVSRLNTHSSTTVYNVHSIPASTLCLRCCVAALLRHCVAASLRCCVTAWLRTVVFRVRPRSVPNGLVCARACRSARLPECLHARRCVPRLCIVSLVRACARPPTPTPSLSQPCRRTSPSGGSTARPSSSRCW